jgi:hypothetical protein
MQFHALIRKNRKGNTVVKNFSGSLPGIRQNKLPGTFRCAVKSPDKKKFQQAFQILFQGHSEVIKNKRPKVADFVDDLGSRLSCAMPGFCFDPHQHRI